MIKKSLKEEGVLAPNRKIFNFPGDAQNIRLKIENDTGVVWQPRRVIIDRVLDRKDLNKCYQVVGTALNSSFDNNCQ